MEWQFVSASTSCSVACTPYAQTGKQSSVRHVVYVRHAFICDLVYVCAAAGLCALNAKQNSPAPMFRLCHHPSAAWTPTPVPAAFPAPLLKDPYSSAPAATAAHSLVVSLP
jgi:hypothetical protein